MIAALMLLLPLSTQAWADPAPLRCYRAPEGGAPAYLAIAEGDGGAARLYRGEAGGWKHFLTIEGCDEPALAFTTRGLSCSDGGDGGQGAGMHWEFSASRRRKADGQWGIVGS